MFAKSSNDFKLFARKEGSILGAWLGLIWIDHVNGEMNVNKWKKIYIYIYKLLWWSINVTSTEIVLDSVFFLFLFFYKIQCFSIVLNSLDKNFLVPLSQFFHLYFGKYITFFNRRVLENQNYTMKKMKKYFFIFYFF